MRYWGSVSLAVRVKMSMVLAVFLDTWRVIGTTHYQEG